MDDIELDIEDLRRTAALAHLNLPEAELEAAFPAFRQMLAYFAVMQPSSGSQTTSVPQPSSDGDAGLDFAAFSSAEPALAKRFRQDAGQSGAKAESGGASAEEKAAMLDSAGERDGRFIVVPNVL
jgi:aspartyl-tRNA(Asn)/glutamyl-tRNA(Gln) amidotransferase subunit C